MYRIIAETIEATTEQAERFILFWLKGHMPYCTLTQPEVTLQHETEDRTYEDNITTLTDSEGVKIEYYPVFSFINITIRYSKASEKPHHEELMKELIEIIKQN